MTVQPATQIADAVKDGRQAAELAARVLAAGGLVAFPTETVYGLGADATNGRAIARLYEAKGRPAFNPLIAHVTGLAAARALGQFDARGGAPRRGILAGAADARAAEGCRLSGRRSRHRRPRQHRAAGARPSGRAGLLTAFGRPVVAPSANRSGHVSPTTAAHVLADLRGRIELILDGGPTRDGTGIDHRRLSRRAGAAAAGRTRRAPRSSACWRRPLAATAAVAQDAPTAPGQLASHYAPRARLRLDATAVNAGEALLAFGPELPPGAEHAARVLNLSPRGDLIEAAANLFSHLRALDAAAGGIAVMPVPHEGLGEAINDRLARAAAPRES